MKRVGPLWLAPLFAALVGVLAGCGGQPHSFVPGSAGAPVPWISNPGTTLSAVSVYAQRACQGTDLSTQAGKAGAYHGFATQDILLTNRGAAPCFLSGPPTGAALLDNGGRRAVAGTVDSSVAHRLDLAAGQTAHMTLGTPGACASAGNPQVASHVQLSLASGEQLLVSGTWVNVECGAPMVVLFYADPAPVTNVPASSLLASYSGPHSVARGSVLQYFITLHNPSNKAVSLNACPSYTQELSASPSSVIRQTLLLNCSAMPAIGAGAAIVFEMQLTVPSAFPQGATKLGWALQVPNGPSAGTVIQVE